MLKIKRAIALVWQSSSGWTLIHVTLTTFVSILPLALLYIIKLIVDNIAISLRTGDKTQIFSHIIFLLFTAVFN